MQQAAHIRPMDANCFGMLQVPLFLPCFIPYSHKPPTGHPDMYASFEESVLDAADRHGNLSFGDATELLDQHGFTLADVYEDNHGVDPVWLDQRNAQALLFWLGY